MIRTIDGEPRSVQSMLEETARRRLAHFPCFTHGHLAEVRVADDGKAEITACCDSHARAALRWAFPDGPLTR